MRIKYKYFGVFIFILLDMFSSDVRVDYGILNILKLKGIFFVIATHCTYVYL